MIPTNGVIFRQNFMAQTATLATTNLIAPGPGQYRLLVYTRTNTAGTGNVIPTIGWTDIIGAKTLALPTVTLTAGAFSGTTTFFPVASGVITLAVAWTTSGTYDVEVVLERVFQPAQ